MITELTPLVGESVAIRRARQLIERYAPTNMTILVVGATGTGKEVVARHVHARSGRPGAFQPVNCAALPSEMIEGLLFGHRKGAFSGAIASHRGFIECADRGTLFLDEALCLPTSEQAKLLRVIETHEVQPLGAERIRPVEVRFVAAVQESVGVALDRGAFRRDLYQRLADVVIELPRLVERPEDVVMLADHYAALQGRVLEPGARVALGAYDWPGNVRELRQVLDRAGHLVVNGTMPADAVLEAIALGLTRLATRQAKLPDLTPDQIVTACVAHGWDGRHVAAALGVHRATLYRRLRLLGTSLRRLRLSHERRATPSDCDSATR